MTTSKEIIQYLDKKYPQQKDQLVIVNCVERNFSFQQKVFVQYILGVTLDDRSDSYKAQMAKSLANVSQHLSFPAWGYSSQDNDSMKAVLAELA
jgi:hypothetical protein